MTRIYIGALMDRPVELVQKAVIHGVKHWRFFPSIAEILDAIEQVECDPAGNERAYQQLRAAYDHVHDTAPLPPSEVERQRLLIEGEVAALAKVKRMEADGLVTRKQLLEAGVYEPRELTPIEFEARIRELERQRDQLLRQQPQESPDELL